MLPSAVVQLLPTPVADNSRGLPSATTDYSSLPNAVVALLPTPAASNPNDGESPETWLARRERVKESARNGNGMGMPLGIAVRRGGTRGDELLLKGIATQQAWGPYRAAMQAQKKQDSHHERYI